MSFEVDIIGFYTNFIRFCVFYLQISNYFCNFAEIFEQLQQIS